MMQLFARQRYAAIFLASVLAIVVNISAAQTLPAGMARVTAVEGITEYRLDNGLKVLLFPDASKPTVTVNVTYLVGSRHENYGETGMAHLLEHMMFKGTPGHPKLAQDFTTRGMRWNGTTWLDRTNFYELFDAGGDNLKWAIEMEADRMVHSNIARKDLDTEMTVVRNEFENGENSPFSVLLKRMQSIAFDWHNYGHATIGNRSDIEHVKIANLQAFYRTYYQPDNAVLLVAGKFDAVQTLDWIAHAFGPIAKPARALPEFWTVEPTQDGDRSFTVRRKGDIQLIDVGYKSPGTLHRDSDALDFACQILADTPNGRLHKLLVESGKAAEVFHYGLNGYAPGMQILGAVVKKGEAVAPVRDALVGAIEAFSKTPPTPEEMERVRRDYANRIERTLSDPEKVGIALSESIALGDWRLLFHRRDLATKVTAEQVAAVAARYFKRDNRIVGTFLPEDHPQRAEIPAAPAVATVMQDFKAGTQAAAAEAFDPSQANIDARTVRSKVGGLDLALLAKKNRGETVAVTLRLHWGDEKTLFGKKTVSDMTNAMLMRGSSGFTRDQLADEFSKLKITGNPFRFETTRAHLDEALRLVAHVLQEPAFPQSEFEQLRQQTLVDIDAMRNDPQTLARQAIAEHFNVYPQGDWRAVATIDQMAANVKAVSLADVKAFHKDFYGASKGELAIVGDFDASAATKVVAQAFGQWKSAAPYTRVAQRYADVMPVRENINTPDKENGFYSARLNLDMRDDDPDFPAMTVANYIFGGAGINSRVMQRIRQKDGLSYGCGSGLAVDSLDRAAHFSMGAIAAPQNLAKVDAALKEELVRALKDGFSTDEVARAKTGLLQTRAQNRAQDGVLAAGWSSFLYLGRTFAWSKAFEDKLSALTVEQVNAAFRKAIDPARLTVVMAGDHAKIKAAAVKP